MLGVSFFSSASRSGRSPDPDVHRVILDSVLDPPALAELAVRAEAFKTELAAERKVQSGLVGCEVGRLAAEREEMKRRLREVIETVGCPDR